MSQIAVGCNAGKTIGGEIVVNVTDRGRLPCPYRRVVGIADPPKIAVDAAANFC
jgi:hypothetical protein